MAIDGALLLDQLTWHWDAQLRPRLDGLTDEEYLAEPVAGCWSVRPEAEPSAAPVRVGAGAMKIDFDFEPPDPPPVTTIAWRLAHVTVGVLGLRNATYFDGPEVTYESYDYPPTAAGALRALDEAYRRWTAGIEALSADELAAPCREQGFETDPLARLVLHIHREVIHHGAEVALLRDLWAHGLTGHAAAAVE